MRPVKPKPAGRWTKVSEEVTCRGRRGQQTFSTWKCGGCGFRAVTTGHDPGKCLNRACTLYGGD